MRSKAKPVHKIWAQAGKILLGFIVFVFACMLILPSLLDDWISRKVTDLTGEYLQAELHFKDTEASFFRSFPSFTLTMEDAVLMGAGPFRKESFIQTEALVFTLNVWRLLFTGQVDIDEIKLRNSQADFKTDKFGRVNYNVIKPRDTISDQEDTAGTDLNLDRIRIENADLTYSDQLRGLQISTRGFEYDGAGTFRNNRLELGSQFEMDTVDVTFQDVEYLKKKRLKANLYSVYDDRTVSLLFERDNLAVNDLELSFNGQLDFEPDGYSYEVDIITTNSHLRDILSLLPAEYGAWREKLELRGMVDAKLNVSGLKNSDTGPSDTPRIALEMELREGRLKYRDAALPLENIFFDLDGSLDDGIFEIQADTLSLTVGEEFSRGHFMARGRPDSINLKTRLHAQLNLHTLQESLQLPTYTFGGHLNADITAEGIYQQKANRFPVTDAEITVTDGFLKADFPDPLENVDLDFELKNTNGALTSTSLDLKNLSFDFEDHPFQVSAYLKDFVMLDYDIQAKGSLDLNSLGKVVPIPGLNDFSGFMRLDARFKGHMEPTGEGKAPKFVSEADSGTLFLEDVLLNVKDLPKPVKIVSGDFIFRLGKLEFSEFQLEYGNNHSLLNGYFKDYLLYFFTPEGVLQGDFDYKSAFVDLDELLPKKEVLQDVTSDSLNLVHSDSLIAVEEITGVLQVPSRINFKLNLDVDTLRHFKLNVTDLKGLLTITEGGFLFNDTRMNMVGGSAKMKGYYRPEGNDKALFSYNLQGEDLNVKRAYEEIDLFNELVPAAENADGIISLDYEIKGSLDTEMKPIVPSLEGGGTLNVHDVQFKNYKFFGSVSRETRLNALKDPNIKEITIHSTIDDNILELERFKFRVHPFRLRMEGESSLDGDMDLQMRLGLPPFGLIGIPIKITGTSDSLNIKLGKRERDLEALTFEDDQMSEQERLRFRMLRDSITEDMSIEQIDAFEKRMDSLYVLPRMTPPDSLTSGTAEDAGESRPKSVTGMPEDSARTNDNNY